MFLPPKLLIDVFQMSSVSVADFEPEQQIMMVLFASCSSLLRNKSRWSGIPSMTPRLAGAADALGAGVIHGNSGFQERGQDGPCWP